MNLYIVATSLDKRIYVSKKGHTANYLACPRAPKRAPPPEKAATRRAPARAVSSTLSNAPPASKNNQTFANDLSQLMSITNSRFSRKFRTAANPTEKLLCLIEHYSLVEAIKNNKF
ncbi:hypothetical protein EVAR_2939_1 [Eumeta japonica]|uniref:Uncharacterized protein n=1 Tax=Eumeta variegata TaxID=151549 RepID=A0A4C1T0V3_EUMVA|nr:hypothetical protein EVAR_2939_1 [Eumeta japonica]